MKTDKKVCFEFMTVTRLIKRWLDNNTGVKDAEEYTGNNIWILGYLFHNQEHDVFQKDIEESFSVRRSTVSKAVKLMTEKGLIKREPVEYDARLKKLTLTEKAIRINEAITAQMQKTEEKFVSGLSDEEIRFFSEILCKIRKNFEDCNDCKENAG